MRRVTLPWACTASLFVGAAAFAYYAWLPKPTTLERRSSRVQAPALEARDARGDAELSRMRNELTAVKGQLLALGQRVQEAPARVEEAPSAPEEPLLDETQRRAESDRRWQEHMAAVSAAFREEPIDRAWSETTGTALKSAIEGDPLLREAAGPMECRTHTCRVELRHDGSGKVDKQLPLFAASVQSTLSNIQAEHVAGADGAARIVLYLSNESALDTDQDVAP
jgi:hypothetical protein